jgi:hypothetical protein
LTALTSSLKNCIFLVYTQYSAKNTWRYILFIYLTKDIFDPLKLLNNQQSLFLGLIDISKIAQTLLPLASCMSAFCFAITTIFNANLLSSITSFPGSARAEILLTPLNNCSLPKAFICTCEETKLTILFLYESQLKRSR